VLILYKSDKHKVRIVGNYRSSSQFKRILNSRRRR
jgi:hypothetical protein